MNLLGNTIESIAWNKAGIMKEGSKVFTVPQTEAAMKVLQERSIEKKVKHFPQSNIYIVLNLSFVLFRASYMLFHAI